MRGQYRMVGGSVYRGGESGGVQVYPWGMFIRGLTEEQNLTLYRVEIKKLSSFNVYFLCILQA